MKRLRFLLAGLLILGLGNRQALAQSGPPMIIQDLTNLTVAQGTAATFTIQASGSAPLNYQWFFNGGLLTGVTNTNYSIASAQPGNQGRYQVEVANALGSVTSSVVMLTVLPPVLTNTLNLQSGKYNLIADQLDNGSNALDEVLTNFSVPVCSSCGDTLELLKWVCAGWEVVATYYDANDAAPNPPGWYDLSGNPSLLTLAPGNGVVIYYEPASSNNFLTVIFTGTPNVPVLPATLPCGCGTLNVLSRQTNDIGTYQNITGLNPIAGAQVLTLSNSASFTFVTNIYTGTNWTLGTPSLAVGQAAMIYVPCAGTNQCFTVNCSTNKSVACGSAWTFDVPTATSCCGTNFAITVLSTVTNSGPCPLVVTRTWQITDSCTNFGTCSQTVTVVNTNLPTVMCANNLLLSGGQSWNIAELRPTVSEACCTNFIYSVNAETNVSTNSCGIVTNITVVWQVTDCCDNTFACTNTVTVVASTLSILSTYAQCGGSNLVVAFNNPVSVQSAGNPANYQIVCSGQIIPILSAQVSSNQQLVALTLGESFEGGGCSLTITNLQDLCDDTVNELNTALGCGTNTCAYNNSGSEFWLTFPGNYAPDPNNPPQVELYISGAQGITGNVSMANPVFSASFTIPSAGWTSVTLPVAADLGNANDVIKTNGVHVLADGPIVIDAFDHVPYTTDAYLALPTTALGYTYINLSYSNVFVGAPDLNGTQFAIVATANNTMVTIQPPVQVGSHPANVSFTINLMQGQTYQLRDTNDFPADLTGTAIASTQPIAVFGSHQCAALPSGNDFFCDYLVQQLLPVPMWGTNFLTVPFATRTKGDTFRCLAWQTNTQVFINGVFAGTINARHYFETQLLSASQITATKPILVAQYADSSDYDNVLHADPFMCLVPPTAFYGSSYEVVVPPTNYFPSVSLGTGGGYLNIVAHSGNPVAVDSVAVPAGDFTALGSTGYSWTQQFVGTGPHSITGVGGTDIGVSVYGWAQYDAYGYPAGFCAPVPMTTTNVFSSPVTNVFSVAATSNNVAIVPDLTGVVGNATSAFLILQAPQTGTLLYAGSYPVSLTAIDQFGQRYPYQVTLNVTGPYTGPLTVNHSGTTITLTWPGNVMLQSAVNLAGPWTAVQGAVSPYTVPVTNAHSYFRTVLP